MDLTAQVSGLQEDVKLLKAEIKHVLKEIRTAVLNSDNPFAPNAAARVAGPATPDAAEQPPETAIDSPDPKPPAGATASSVPNWPRPSEAAATPQPPAAPPTAPATPEPQPPGRQERRGAQPRWTLLTIAGLMEWAEEAIDTLGRRRFEIVLELAAAADLLPADTRDVLRRIATLSATDDRRDGPMNVVECLVVLRQLEALVQGETITRLPLRREQRSGAA